MTDPNAFLGVDPDTLIGLLPPRRVVFSIGSNLGDRLAQLQGAVDSLRVTPELKVRAVSSVYETAPVGPVTDQPEFLNIIVVADSTLTSHVLLERAHAIEDAYRRRRDVPSGPRTLDVDLVAVGSRIKDTATLTLPHPRAHERAFVLIPWLEVDPDAEIPDRGRVRDLLAGLDRTGVRLRRDLVVEFS